MKRISAMFQVSLKMDIKLEDIFSIDCKQNWIQYKQHETCANRLETEIPVLFCTSKNLCFALATASNALTNKRSNTKVFNAILYLIADKNTTLCFIARD